ncbi:MAG TPA: hypothetical protein VF251_03030, partial [Pyrinomonadaceae bacterium]
MLPRLNPNRATLQPETYPFGEKGGPTNAAFALALVSLSHTPVEQRIYAAMLESSVTANANRSFTARELTGITGVRSLTTIRRALEGLLAKLSVERSPKTNGHGRRDFGISYRVYTPVEVLRRRKDNNSGNGDLDPLRTRNHSFDRAIVRVAEHPLLSRREAQV